jgi:FAD/FMN-containing dehydrogenase
LNDFFVLSSQFDDKHEYTVSWIDCLATGHSVGRGVYIAGDHSKQGSLALDTRRKMRVPFTPAFSAINSLTLRMFNSAYYHIHRKRKKQSLISYEPFFYPLDRILNWNRIYGAHGFQQYQCVIPDRFAEAGIKELLDVIASAGRGSFLAILKRCGNIASPGLLSFPLHGVSLALDFPQDQQLSHILFPRLDTIVRQSGGRLYPAKDAHMIAEDFRKSFPAWQQVEILRDPALCSRFWKRIIT